MLGSHIKVFQGRVSHTLYIRLTVGFIGVVYCCALSLSKKLNTVFQSYPFSITSLNSLGSGGYIGMASKMFEWLQGCFILNTIYY